MLGYSGPVQRLKPVLDNKTAIQWRITTAGTIRLKECLGMQPAVYLEEKCCSAGVWTYTRQKMEYDSQRCTGITERRCSRVLQDGAVRLAKVTEWGMISLCLHSSLGFLIQVDYLVSGAHFTGRSLKPRRQSAFITYAWLAHDPTYRPHWLALRRLYERWWSQCFVNLIKAHINCGTRMACPAARLSSAMRDWLSCYIWNQSADIFCPVGAGKGYTASGSR